MKKEFLQNELLKLGIDIAEETQSTFFTAIQAENGKDIEHAKSKAIENYNDYETLKEENLSYKKGGINYIDKEDYNRLKQFEIEIELSKTRAQQETAVKELLSDPNLKISADIAELLIPKIEAEFNEDNSIKNADDIKKLFTEGGEYSKYRTVETTIGASAATPPPTQGIKNEPQTLGEALKQKYK